MQQVNYFLGLDLGLRRDPTALAVLEKLPAAPSARPWVSSGRPSLVLRGLYRFPLETPYAEIPGRLSAILAKLSPRVPTTLAVDATGVGAPVVEMLRRASLPATILPVIFTGGSTARQHAHAITVPRRALLENLRSLFENRSLTLPATLPLLADLRKELLGIGKPKPSPDDHDDLAFALALAAWPARPLPTVGPKPNPIL